MRVNIMIEGQEGPTYDDLLAVARRTEQRGLAGLYRSDHYTSATRPDERGSTDAWTTLAGLARETERLRLGTLVSPATFHTAGNLAKTAATVASMAGTHDDGDSRIVLGLGTGWMEIEHRRHGFPFEDLDTRFRRLEEYLQVVSGLWDPAAAPLDFEGSFVRIEGGRMLPPPQPRPRLVTGGSGLRRSPLLAARYADEFNTVFAGPQRCARMRSALDHACEAVDRDPASLPLSVMTGVVVGADGADLRARGKRLLSWLGMDMEVDDWLDEQRDSWIIGTPDEAAAHLGSLREAGVEQVMLQLLLVDDLETIDLLADEVAARL